MAHEEHSQHSHRALLDALRAVSETARLKAHLLSLDTKQRLSELESELHSLLPRFDSETVAESVIASARDLTRDVRELLRNVDGASELATPVREIMTTETATCTPGDSLNRASQIMWEHDCGAVPVVGDDGALVGMVTDRDVCIAAYTQGRALSAISVASAMSREVIAGSPDDTVGEVLRILAERQLRRLPLVLERRLVGIITLADLAGHIQRHHAGNAPAGTALAHALARISEPRLAPGASSRAAAE